MIASINQKTTKQKTQTPFFNCKNTCNVISQCIIFEVTKTKERDDTIIINRGVKHTSRKNNRTACSNTEKYSHPQHTIRSLHQNNHHPKPLRERNQITLRKIRRRELYIKEERIVKENNAQYRILIHQKLQLFKTEILTKYCHRQLSFGSKNFRQKLECPNCNRMDSKDMDHDYFLECEASEERKEVRLKTVT